VISVGPGGRHVAIIFNIAYEAWSEGKAPGIGPMGNPLPSGAFDAMRCRGAITAPAPGSSGYCAYSTGTGCGEA
jgi:hypothetical protein